MEKQDIMDKKYSGEHVWDSKLDPEKVLFTFSSEAQKEAREFVKSLPLLKDFTDIKK